MALFMLFESASGYALFEVTEADELGQTSDTVQVRGRAAQPRCKNPTPPHTQTSPRPSVGLAPRASPL